MTNAVMPLARALHILIEAHTRDDHQMGFTVEMYGIRPDISRIDYIEAWRSVRYNTGKDVGPLPQ
jgi:hypothetical protein